jgi:hypothetical protein
METRAQVTKKSFKSSLSACGKSKTPKAEVDAVNLVSGTRAAAPTAPNAFSRDGEVAWLTDGEMLKWASRE